MELLLQGNALSFLLAAGSLFVTFLLGLAAKDLWHQIKRRPLVVLPLVIALLAVIAGFGLFIQAGRLLVPNETPAILLHVRYALSVAVLISMLFAIPALIVTALQAWLMREFHRELQTFQKNFSKSTSAPKSSP